MLIRRFSSYFFFAVVYDSGIWDRNHTRSVCLHCCAIYRQCSMSLLPLSSINLLPTRDHPTIRPLVHTAFSRCEWTLCEWMRTIDCVSSFLSAIRNLKGELSRFVTVAAIQGESTKIKLDRRRGWNNEWTICIFFFWGIVRIWSTRVAHFNRNQFGLIERVIQSMCCTLRL